MYSRGHLLLALILTSAVVTVTAVKQSFNTSTEAVNYCQSNCSDTTIYTCVFLSFTPTAEVECKCNNGFKGDGITCDDVNECVSPKDNNCHPEANCTNSFGSYSCKCKDGYKDDFNQTTVPGVVCEDINECTADPMICDTSNSDCENLKGDYKCNCMPGFENPFSASTNEVDQHRCENINECLNDTLNSCPADSKCVDTTGSYTCQCVTGFEKLPNGTCQDIDECLTKCGSNGNCTNYAGGYSCLCRPGFENVNETCTDINECLDDDLNNCNLNISSCRNTPGSYVCDCITGYEYIQGQGCQDINECKDKIKYCDLFAKCENSIGSYQCECVYGYIDVDGDGTNCTEISPTLEELSDSLEKTSYTQLLIEYQQAYYKSLSLEAEQEQIRRLCPLKKAGLLDKRRIKREAVATPDTVYGSPMKDLRITVETVKNYNNKLQLENLILRTSCNLD